MEISYIALTRTETKLLRKSVKVPIPKDKCRRLIRLNLVNEITECNNGDMPKGTELCMITNKGTDFLLFRKQLQKDMWMENAWIPATISAATSLLVNLLPKMIQMIQ